MIRSTAEDNMQVQEMRNNQIMMPIDLNSDDAVIDIEGKVKARLQSFKTMWNNMKYGMKLKTNFSKESPVWLLGRCYHRRTEQAALLELGTDVAAFTSQTNLTNSDDDSFGGFKADFHSRIWMTYRREFPIMTGSQFTSDCGWGCMLRSGQMLLAQALVLHFLGRDWRWQPDVLIATAAMNRQMTRYRNIIKWFGDQPTDNCPLSIHALVHIAETVHGKKAGDWYGPAAVAHLLREAVLEARRVNDEFGQLAVYVAQDCCVYLGDIYNECTRTTASDRSEWYRSLIILIPLRLGTEKFNPVYEPCIQALLSLEQCIGIIGGRPKHSLYFVGYQDDKLIHLDPHYCQDMVDVWQPDFPLASFHCRSPRKLLFNRMDPSCCVGFYCRSRQEFELLISNLQECAKPTRTEQMYPMFVVSDGFGKDAQTCCTSTLLPMPSDHLDFSLSMCTDADSEHFETEEFELI